MIDCPNAEIRDRLPDFVHGHLDAEARAAVAAHAAGCAACAAELALLRELRATFRTGPALDVARIVAALPAPPTGRTGAASQVRRPQWRRFDWRIAAGIVALAGGVGSAIVVTMSGRDAGVADRRVAVGSDARRVVPTPGVARESVTVADLSIDADLGEATTVELQELLADLEAFDGLPAGEPEPTLPTPGEEELDR
jgi:anti-sigma factor RsiW